jgi:hypothetical protein
MSTVTTDSMNVTLASFEGRKFYGHTIDEFGGNTGNELPEMKYHTSWNWLMLVYHNVREKAFELKDDATAAQLFAKVMEQLLYGTIADVHLHLYQFITWYNQQKQTNE